MLIDPIPLYPRRRRVKTRPTQPATPVAEGPVLTAAAFDGEAETLTLVFDRDVSMTGLVPADVFVDDGDVSTMRYVATGDTERPDGRSVVITMVEDGGAQAGGPVLTATPGNGITAVIGGRAWGGVTQLSLPFAMNARQKKRRKRAA